MSTASLLHSTLRRGQHSTRHDDATNDPADWNRSSQESHPIDLLEPEEEVVNIYREVGIRALRVNICMAEFVLDARDPRMAMMQVCIALDLPPAQGQTLTAIANKLQVSKQAVSRGVTRFLRIARLDPAVGLKSIDARIRYRTCRFQT